VVECPERLRGNTDELVFSKPPFGCILRTGSAAPWHPHARFRRSRFPGGPRLFARDGRPDRALRDTIEARVSTRRDFLRNSALVGGAAMLPRWARADGGGSGDQPRSPSLRPFVQELPSPPIVQPVPAFTTSRVVPPGAVFNELRVREGTHQFHPDLPASIVWGYSDVNSPNAPLTPGPTFVSQAGTPRVVRFDNLLPANHKGFGVPNAVVHRHGGLQASEDDGFPLDFFKPGQSRDFVWPETHPDDPRDSQGTLWYHDHLVDFTAQNVYKGLAGFFIRFSPLDTGDETRPGTTGLQLPSGPFDIAFVIQDRVFDRNGQLVYDSNQHDGFLGDTFVLNGAVQPFLRVKRRKYRFRVLNGSNARFYELFLSNGQNFTQIGTEGGFFETPLSRRSMRVAPAERVEFILDFSGTPQGTQIFLQNRLQQDDGRGPDEVGGTPVPLLRFDVDGDAPDPSVIPARLRQPFPQAPAPAIRRHFEFARSHGGWVVDGEFWDVNRIVAKPRLFEPETWVLKNGGGGWFHPIHIHLSLFQIMKRNGGPPPPEERALKDTVVLGPNDEVELKIAFEDFRGRYVFHCHNIEHEDMAMMARFDTI
jgi:FtsP/CotA-like multicopper oxidase with cupredoxin domain